MKKSMLCVIVAVFLAYAQPLSAGSKKVSSPQQRHDTYMGYAQNYRQKAVKFEGKSSKFEGEKAQACTALAGVYRLMADEKQHMAKAYLNEDAKAGTLARERYTKLRTERASLEGKLYGHKASKKAVKKHTVKPTTSAKDKEIAELKAQMKELTQRLEAVETK